MPAEHIVSSESFVRGPWGVYIVLSTSKLLYMPCTDVLSVPAWPLESQ